MGRNGKKPGPPVHDDLCAVVDEKGRARHEFTATAPKQLWIGDITEHWTNEGKLYLCAFKDVYSNRIVGYSNRLQDEVPPRRHSPEQRRRPPR